MGRVVLTLVGVGALGAALVQAQASSTGPTPAPAAARQAPARTSPARTGGAGMSAVEQTALVKQYCTTCHNDRARTGGLTLASFDAARLTEDAETAERMIRRLRAGMMPPSGARRPAEETLAALAAAMEATLDRAAAAHPNPGWRPFQRLNRAEYTAAVKDLLDVDVDVAQYLPPDTISDGFDNVADVQSFSATLMEGYLRAASQISRLAVGDRNASPSETTYKVPRTSSQMHHIAGTPIGTRGGTSVVHTFPADGLYTFRLMLHGSPTGQLYGGPVPDDKIEVSIDGVRVALVDINPRMDESDPNGLNLFTPRVYVKAGPHRVSAAFLQRFDGPVDDLLAPIEHTLADTNIGETYGVTALAHLRDLTIVGPHEVTGVSETPSRRRIFTCRPTAPGEETACATEIVRRLAARAYRGAVSAEDMKGLMSFFDQGRAKGGFENGVRFAIQAMLVNPRFLFRMEQVPATVRAGDTYRLTDVDLASRLSFFLWGAPPDAELLRVARQGGLATDAGVEAQVRRLLADPRSEALATRFAGQWLRLQDVEKVRPDHHFYPLWDTRLSQAFVRETELLFDSLIRDDRSILDLLTADYTFVNERIARHYGIPNVIGEHFRRVPVPDYRRGILGHGSILLLTSVADRTSPVQRGRWVMEVLLGTPPPPPPPNVPALEEIGAGGQAKRLSVRERMEEHRKNPACTSCHKLIDPLGLALENFDVTGAWRIKDSEVPVDPVGELYDGTRVDGPAGLRQALVGRKDVFLLSFTESLMTYALGRRLESGDMPAVRAIVRQAAASDYKLSAFVTAVASSPAFRMGRLSAPAASH
ncbi:MAG: DUF1592 domain-containing protein [Acidobacteriota bacterium]